MKTHGWELEEWITRQIHYLVNFSENPNFKAKGNIELGL